MTKSARSRALPRMLGSLLQRLSGLAAAGIFYSAILAFPVEQFQRYFLGHPVAIAATILFWIAATALATKSLAIRYQRRLCAQIREVDLLPPDTESFASASSRMNVRELTSQWSESLKQLPRGFRDSLLVCRLSELLQRQQRRGNARHLADDLREVSGRDADDAHDSLQLVRIIIWAIPMLGFLGTVIGITQTLGGLDFSDGQAAVDRLKSGLYVAFDTTALGLVLSVVAIFLQFPVERAEQALLAIVDRRTGELLGDHLPDPLADTSADQISALCDGVLEAVKQSVATQAELWRSTIDGAHAHWQQIVSTTGEELSEAIGQAISPALISHAESLQRVQREGAAAIDARWQQWQVTLSDNARILQANQESLIHQSELLTDSHSRAHELAALQQTLGQNIESLTTINRAVDQSLASAAGAQGMADAVRSLARAVDLLSSELPNRPIRRQAWLAQGEAVSEQNQHGGEDEPRDQRTSDGRAA